MSDHLLPYLANCSLLFTEEPLLRRPAAARAAGFRAVEFWWPFAVPVPSDREVDAFTTAIEEAGVALAGLNFFAGDLAGPDCGVLSIPGRSAEFRDNITWWPASVSGSACAGSTRCMATASTAFGHKTRTSWPSRTSGMRRRRRPGSAPQC